MKKQIALIASKGGTGKTTLVECFRQFLQATEVVDLDHQKTLTLTLQMAGKSLAVEKAQYTIYDTPPYNDETLRALMTEVDYVVIPAKLGYPDMVALKTIYNGLRATNTLKKATLVFNEVRKPLTNEQKEIIKCFENNYPKLRRANVLISRLDGFSKVFRAQLKGKALVQTRALINEILNKQRI